MSAWLSHIIPVNLWNHIVHLANGKKDAAFFLAVGINPKPI